MCFECISICMIIMVLKFIISMILLHILENGKQKKKTKNISINKSNSEATQFSFWFLQKSPTIIVQF